MAEGTGTLYLHRNRHFRIRVPNANGGELSFAVPEVHLSQSLKQEPREKFNGLVVEFDLEGGQPRRVRPVGESFVKPASSPLPAQNNPSKRPPNREYGTVAPHLQTRSKHQPPPSRDFHNPYNFVPALPRQNIAGDLGDRIPISHQVLHSDRYTGVVRVTMTTRTPLLLPDPSNVLEYTSDQTQHKIKQGHKTYPVRVDSEKKPSIPSTSIKGMLRAAYEAVTNSRMAVFAGHEDRLADRMPATAGLSLVPVRVIEVDGVHKLELLPGTSEIGPDGKPVQNQPMYAAWLPRYKAREETTPPWAIRYPDGSLPQHGDRVEVWLELWKRGPFKYWSVRACVPEGQELVEQPQPGTRRGSHCPVANTRMVRALGYVCVTNRNIDRKHDERVFFTNREQRLTRPLTDQLRRQWKELITNYQTTHEGEVEAGRRGPPAVNNALWSRHVTSGKNERELATGTLCFASFREDELTALYPVMISRRLFESSPLSLLHESLRPASSLTQLSPADRVFGWVGQNGEGAYKGNIRIGPITCRSKAADAIKYFDAPGLPLAILGQPKPQQARFYVAADDRGTAQRYGLSKEDAGYSSGKGLRGRKVYPHHQSLPEGYWDQPEKDPTQHAMSGHFQEYLRPDSEKLRDNQNRSILGWVKPDTEFSFDLHVTNLSSVELGALLWLLNLPENHFHRFGGGKPLGFGSVRLEIDATNTRLNHGEQWKQIYSTLEDVQVATDQAAFVQAFQEEVRTKYGSASSFEEVPFIAAWLRMATGHPSGLPTHYPRTRQDGASGPVPPHPDGKSYEWFVENDRAGRDAVSLPDLTADRGLPILSKRR